jgi:hypothetical protein
MIIVTIVVVPIVLLVVLIVLHNTIRSRGGAVTFVGDEFVGRVSVVELLGAVDELFFSW